MSSGQIANRYANALLDFGNEKGIAKELYDNTHLLTNIFAQNDDLKNLIEDQASMVQQKIEAIRRALSGRVNKVLVDFIAIMLEKHRASYVYNALLLYQHNYRKQNNILEVKVESAKMLGKKELERITKFIGENYKKDLDVSVEVKPELIAGIVLIVDGKMVDLSVLGQLNDVRKTLGVN